MTSRLYGKEDICTLRRQISKNTVPKRDLSRSRKSHIIRKNDDNVAIKVAATALILLGFAFAASSSAKAQRVSSSIAWGNYETSGNGSSHLDDAYIALLAEQGRAASLPGTTNYAIGVLNSINVIGDDNLLNSTQEGQNNGDVSSEITFNQ
jgi:hypothetical protein